MSGSEVSSAKLKKLAFAVRLKTRLRHIPKYILLKFFTDGLTPESTINY